MSLVRGKDVIIQMERVDGSGDYVITGCSTSCTIQRTVEEINITTADSGPENEYEGGARDAAGTFDGVITIDELPMWQYEDWAANIGNKKRIRFDFTSTFGDRLRYEMVVLITGVDATGDVNDFAMFNVSWKRSGAETVTKIYDNALVDGGGELILDGGGNIIRV